MKTLKLTEYERLDREAKDRAHLAFLAFNRHLLDGEPALAEAALCRYLDASAILKRGSVVS